MRLSLITTLLSAGIALAAPVASAKHHLTERDGLLIQKAWMEIGDLYLRQGTAFSAQRAAAQLTTSSTIGSFGRSAIPSIHEDIKKLFSDTAWTLQRSAALTYQEGSDLYKPSTLLTSKITTSLSSIFAAKAMIIKSGETSQVEKMLVEQKEAYQKWSIVVNSLLTKSQKTGGDFFAAQIITAFALTIKEFQTK